MDLLNEEVIYLDDKIKLTEKTFCEKERYVAGIIDDEVARRNGDWASYVRMSGYNYNPHVDMGVYSDEEKLAYGGYWQEYYMFYKVLFLGDEEIYRESNIKQTNLIIFELGNGKVFVKRPNNIVIDENEEYKTVAYSFKINELTTIDDAKSIVKEAIEIYDKGIERLRRGTNVLKKHGIDIPKKKIPYMNLEDLKKLSKNDLEKMPNEDILRYIIVDFFDKFRNSINSFSESQLFDALSSLELSEEKNSSCVHSYYSSSLVPIEADTYKKALNCKNYMEIDDDYDSELKRYRDLIKFIKSDKEKLEKMPDLEIIRNIVFSLYLEHREYNTFGYDNENRIIKRINSLEISNEKKQSCKDACSSLNLHTFGYSEAEDFLDFNNGIKSSKTSLVKKIKNLFKKNHI